MIDGFREFEFDLPEALLARLIVQFDTMESAPLVHNNLVDIPDAQGVYQLLYEDEIVYVGKTDAEAGLRKRLGRHAWAIQHRCGLSISSVRFRALRVFVFTAIDLETQLIHHYGGRSKVAWNNSGFGSNDPGRQRDKTKIKTGGFDECFPVDLDRTISIEVSGGGLPAVDALNQLRTKLPYIVRWDRAANLETWVPLFSGETTARKVMKAIVGALEPGWQATLLPGRIILYRENEMYTAGAIIARS